MARGTTDRDPSTGCRPATVLLVDDDANIRRLFRSTLELEPDLRVVAEAEDGRAAAETARAVQPDFMVLDWQMPVVDGPAAIPGLQRAAPEACIVLFSNRFGPGAETQAMAAGADMFLE